MRSANKGVAPGVISRFAPEEFSRTLEQLGLEFRWSRALPCTCTLNGVTGQYDPNCDRCLDGWLYANPLYRTDRHSGRDWCLVNAVFSSITFDYTRHEFVPSQWTTGEGMMTVDGHISVGFRDRFVAINQTATFAQVLIRDATADKVPVGWLGRSREAQLSAFRYEPLEVHYIEDDAHNTYVRDIDFEITRSSEIQPGQLKWRDGRGPADGATYTVSYDCHPVWVTDDASFAIQHSFGPAGGISGKNVVQSLPRTFKVGLDWLTERRGE